MKARLEDNIVKMYSQLPTRYMINGIPHNLSKLPESVHEAEGFFNVVTPVITEYQSLIDLVDTDLVGNEWIQRVYDFTAQEVIDYDEAQLESAASNELRTELNDGIEAAHTLKVYLKRQLSVAQYKDARILVRPVWDALRVGDWDIALDEITIIDDANSTVISRKIKTTIENYLA